MFAVVREHGYGKEQCVSLPFVSALISEPDVPRRYYVLPPEKPDHVPENPAPRKWGAQPRRGGREVIPLDE
jgi:hypothetical protein